MAKLNLFFHTIVFFCTFRKNFNAYVDLEYEIGTSKLDVINSLLQAINYTPIHFDRMGNAVAKKYIEPDERAAEYRFL